MTNEIEYNGTQLPIKTDFKVISKVCNKFNHKFQNFTDALEQPEQIVYMFYQSLLRGHELERKVLAYKESEAEDILTDNYADFMHYFQQDCLKMSTKKAELKEASAEHEAKKKLRAK